MRPLAEDEISVLKQQGCTSQDWMRIRVADPFLPERIVRATLGGEIVLGTLDGYCRQDQALPCGIYDANLKDCTVGDRVRISNVGTVIQGYDIGGDACLEHIGGLQVAGQTTFGCGTIVDVVVESGGRGVPLFDLLSAQLAYLFAFYRHDKKLIQCLSSLVQNRIDEIQATRGVIGDGARLSCCGILENVYIGAHAVLEGVAKLTDCMILSEKNDPVLIGAGVQLDSVILRPGAHVESGAVLSNCFVGEGARVGKQFSAENSLFFANAEAFNGEACSAFVGPYAVSHHRSTLLLTALYSFYNAGSGTNFSNHRYKVGPVHQGVMERGCKTASNSYVCWPARVGAFTTVLGRHSGFFDTSAFPFSYLMEEDGASILLPAVNLFTVGTTRDADKWQKRDRRKCDKPLDLIHFDAFNPNTITRILHAVDRLTRYLDETGASEQRVAHRGVIIPRARLHNARDSYELALKRYFGQMVCLLVETANSLDDLRGEFAHAEAFVTALSGTAGWIDLCGLLLPQGSVDSIVRDLHDGTIATVAELTARFSDEYAGYSARASLWASGQWLKRNELFAGTVCAHDLSSAVLAWQGATQACNDKLLNDAQKEFSAQASISFGIDGGREIAAADFEAVRGTYDQNSFVCQIREETEKCKQRAEAVLAKIDRLFADTKA